MTERLTQISIHAPRVGCDKLKKRGLRIHSISIHAPRVGCDCNGARPRNRHENFNPRTPRGVRHGSPNVYQLDTTFQSTHPAWGATQVELRLAVGESISIHAPRVGCDSGNVISR